MFRFFAVMFSSPVIEESLLSDVVSEVPVLMLLAWMVTSFVLVMFRFELELLLRMVLVSWL